MPNSLSHLFQLLGTSCWAHRGLQATWRLPEATHLHNLQCLCNKKGHSIFSSQSIFPLPSSKSTDFHWKLLKSTWWWKLPCTPSAGDKLKPVAPPAQLLLDISGFDNKFETRNDPKCSSEDLAEDKWNPFLVPQYFLRASPLRPMSHTGPPHETALSSLQAGSQNEEEVCVKSTVSLHNYCPYSWMKRAQSAGEAGPSHHS